MARRSWNHGGRTRHERGYGAEHVRIRAELLREVVTCEECARMSETLVRIDCASIVPVAAGQI